MENIPFLKTKLMTPEIPAGALYSKRIQALGISGRRAVVISAPAGYGKTTAVLLSLRNFRDNTHWYRLEKEDAFLSVFYANLVETLFGRNGGESDSRRSLRSIGNIEEDFPLINAVICQEAWTGEAEDRYLVFDDFQNVAETSAINETVQYLISNMPPHMHIVVISRTRTGISAGTPAAESGLLFVDEKDLLFSQEETGQLLDQAGNARATPEYIRSVFEYTEGWIAGITLLIHSRGITGRGALLPDRRQDVFRYLLGEAFSGTEKEWLPIISRISLLTDFTGDDLSGILQIEDPDGVIAWLETHNLYIQKISTSPPTYRLHSLFRDALYSILHSAHTAEDISRYHSDAAGFYAENGRYQMAVQQYISAGAQQEAARIAVVEGQRLMDQGDIDAASGLVQAIPETLVSENATLLMIRGASLLNTETDKSFSCLEKALEMAVKNKEISLAINIEGLMISVCAQRSDFKSIKNIVSRVPMVRSMMASKRARSMMIMSLFTKSVVTDKVRMGKALSRFINRIDSGKDLWDYSNSMTKGTLYGVTGETAQAEEAIAQITHHPVALRNDKWRALGLNISANLSVLMCGRDLSLQLIDSLASIGEKYASGYASGNASYYLGICKYQNRDMEGAVAALEKAETIFVDSRNQAMVAFSRVLRVAWLAEGGNAGNYALQADRELYALAALSPYHGLLELAQTVAAVQHGKNGDYEKAELLLKLAYKGAKGKQARQSICGIAMQLALLYYEKGDAEQEERYLRIFGETANQNGYLYLREMSYPALVRACARCMEKGIAARYMAKIIIAYLGPKAANHMMQTPAEAVADPVAFISRFPGLSEKKAKKIQVKLFGAFGLAVDGAPVGNEVWKTRKISGILKYILANAGKAVPRETLAAVFWPDSNAKAAFSSLRVAIFELRKTLSSFGMAFDSPDALISEDKNGFFVCSPDYVQSDANLFSGLYEKSKAADLPAEEKGALLQQMTDLYDGDFLADDVRDDWIVVLREYYKSIYVAASHQLAELYRKNGQAGQAEALLLKHIQVDPYDEAACRKLMDLFTASGREVQASTLHDQFKRRANQQAAAAPTPD